MAKFPRLKVFRAQIGFFETVVAAPSRPKALEIWGTHQDLFAQGEATELERSDPAAKAALDAPGQALTRPLGSKGAFKPGAEGAPDLPAPKGKAKTPPPDRSRLDAAEAERARLDEEETQTLDPLEAERKALDRRIAAARTDFSQRKQAADAKLDAARKAYRAAGGQGSASRSSRSTT
jgi:hypothetical protein